MRGHARALRARRWLRLAALSAAALVMPYLRAADAGSSPGTLQIIDLRQSDQSLRDTYAKGKRMGLPRLVMLDGAGRLLYGQTGVRDGLRRHLHDAFDKDKPLAVPITLAAVLDEVQDRDGKPVAADSLPLADAYVVDYWASWCSPCRMLERDLQSILGHWDGARIVWIKVESDPEKLPEHRR